MNDEQCPNCATPLQGPHCHVCGQPVKGLVRPLGSILHDALDTVFEYDSRIWRTLPPLYLFPGRITNDYLAGKRMRFVLPFRLFFVLTVITFLVLQLTLDPPAPPATTHSSITETRTLAELEAERARLMAALDARRKELDATQRNTGALATLDAARRTLEVTAEQHAEWLRERNEALERGAEPPAPPSRVGFSFSDSGVWDRETNPLELAALPDAVNARLNDWIARGVRNIERVDEDWDRLVRRFFSLLPPVLFVLVPFFALLLKTFYLFSGRLYMEHLVVALHGHSFLGLATLVLLGLQGLQGVLPDAGLLQGFAGFLVTLALIWIPLYLLMMLKRIYRQGWFWTLIKAGLIGWIYSVILGLATALAVVISLVTA